MSSLSWDIWIEVAYSILHTPYLIYTIPSPVHHTQSLKPRNIRILKTHPYLPPITTPTPNHHPATHESIIPRVTQINPFPVIPFHPSQINYCLTNHPQPSTSKVPPEHPHFLIMKSLNFQTPRPPQPGNRNHAIPKAGKLGPIYLFPCSCVSIFTYMYVFGCVQQRGIAGGVGTWTIPTS